VFLAGGIVVEENLVLVEEVVLGQEGTTSHWILSFVTQTITPAILLSPGIVPCPLLIFVFSLVS